MMPKNLQTKRILNAFLKRDSLPNATAKTSARLTKK